MHKFLLNVMCALVFGCFATFGCQAVYAGDYEDNHPTLNFGAFAPVAPVATKACDCDPCDCGENCRCGKQLEWNGITAELTAEAIACHRSKRQAQAQTQEVNFEPQQITPVQIAPVVVASAETDVCPCCGMKMNAEQRAKVRTMQTAPLPVQQYAPATSYYQAPVTYGYGSYSGGACVGGNCSGGNCSGGNCSGAGRVGLFRRR